MKAYIINHKALESKQNFQSLARGRSVKRWWREDRKAWDRVIQQNYVACNSRYEKILASCSHWLSSALLIVPRENVSEAKRNAESRCEKVSLEFLGGFPIDGSLMTFASSYLLLGTPRLSQAFFQTPEQNESGGSSVHLFQL